VPHSFVRTQQSTFEERESPQGFFFAIAESFRASLAALPFRLPDLQECHAAFDVEQGMPPAKRGRR
jgi:hypothetical protein